MKTHEKAFESLATRGHERGAGRLLADVESELSGAVPLRRPERSRFGGPLVAAAVFLVIVAVGGVALWSTRTTDRGPVAVDSFGVEWLNMVSPANGPYLFVTAGPSGFGRVSFASGGMALEFSDDGEEWAFGEMPADRWLSSLQATDDLWVVTTNAEGPLLAWVSADGQAWTDVLWPPGTDRTMVQAVAAGPGIVATSRDVFGVGTTRWFSTNGQDWVDITDSVPGSVDLLAGSAGIVAVVENRDDPTAVEVLTSKDGLTWVTGRIGVAAVDGEAVHTWSAAAERVNDKWLLLVQVEEPGGVISVRVWISADGRIWDPESRLVLDGVGGDVIAVESYGAIDDVFVMVPLISRADGAVGYAGVWSTSNGSDWTRVVDTGETVGSIALRTTDDLRAVGLVETRPARLTPNLPTTTMVVAPPADLLPEGIALQDDILSDGLVTRDEYRRALDGWQECMEDRGIEAFYELDAGGVGVTFGWDSPIEDAGVAEHNLCQPSFLDRIDEALRRQ